MEELDVDLDVIVKYVEKIMQVHTSLSTDVKLTLVLYHLEGGVVRQETVDLVVIRGGGVR